jgi:hypothetical protein
VARAALGVVDGFAALRLIGGIYLIANRAPRLVVWNLPA